MKIFNTNHAFCLETEKRREDRRPYGYRHRSAGIKALNVWWKRGAQVSAGQPILEMDLDYLNASARSMISPVVCSNIDDFSGRYH